MVNNGYQPGTLTFSVGTTVSRENDEDPNATNELHDIIADDDSFDSPDYLAPGDTFSFMFTTVGTFHYVCDVHNGMEGWITVQ
jgi:plastocyanin